MSDKLYQNFLIIGLGWLGDTLLTYGLCKNIKNYNPEAKITFLCAPSMLQVPSLIKEVDNIIVFDKSNKHKGCFLSGYYKFAKEYEYLNKFDAAIITHRNEASVLCAWVLGSKNIISIPLKGFLHPLNLFINKKHKYFENIIRNQYKADYNSGYLEELNIEIKNYKPEIEIKDENNIDINKFNLPNKYIVLSPESKDVVKDWEYEEVLKFIKMSPVQVVLTGTEKTKILAEKLRNDKAQFIDLCGKTTILELVKILKNAFCCISVDTGTMHLSYASGTETICLFYNDNMVNEWLPKNLNNITLLTGKKFYSSDNKLITEKIISAIQVLEQTEIIGKKNVKV